jgi:hypothetical protein
LSVWILHAEMYFMPLTTGCRRIIRYKIVKLALISESKCVIVLDM